MKKYVKPQTLRVDFSNNICGGGGGDTDHGSGSTGNGNICGVTTEFNVSGKEKTTYQFCYHYADSNGNYSASRGSVICIKPGHGVRFISQETINADGKSYTGWGDFKGSNGLCHYAGRVAIDGVEVTRNNVSQYACQ